MITFEEGLIMTWRFPRFSALYMLLRASFKTLTRTIAAATYFNNRVNNKNNASTQSKYARRERERERERKRERERERESGKKLSEFPPPPPPPLCIIAHQ
jgi:hypothetical protein